MSKIEKSIEAGSRLVIASVWRGEGNGVTRLYGSVFPFGVMKMFWN